MKAWVPRERLQPILGLALPIIGGMISQNVLNLIDTAMVGTLGDEAIAAVGLGGFTNFMSQAVVLGLATGVQAMSARRMGEGKTSEMAMPLNGGLLLVLLLAVPLSGLLYWAAPTLFPVMHSDPLVQQLGTDYYQVRLIGMVAVASNFCFRGYWNGVSLSKLYMRTLLLMHSTNVVISYVLIFGDAGLTRLGLPELGVPAFGSTGAGIGTTASTFLGTAYYFALGLKHARKAGFLTHAPDHTTLRTILRLSIPTGIQQLLFAGGFTMLFWIIGHVGEGKEAAANVAAANVLLNITLTAILPGLGLGLAANSLVGQALGRGDKKDAMRWGWDVAKVGVVLLSVLGLPMAIAPELLLSAFLHTPGTLALATTPLFLVGASIGLDGVGLVLMQALLGAGAVRPVLIIATGTQWLLFLPISWVVGPMLGYGLVGIWLAQVGYRGLQAGLFSIVWRRGTWANIKV